MRNPTKLSQLRSGRSEIENHVIDEFVSGHITRREFLRRGSIIGLSVPMLGAIVSACGGANSASSSGGGSAGGAAKPGASLKIAGVVPTGAINPQSIADEGGLTMMQQTGETLVFNNPKTNLLEPVLATSWKSNEAGDVWTFKLRDGVTFNNGQPMTADDVVYSFQSQTDPKVYVNASSVFSGVLTNDGVEKVDDTTVAFNLEAPNGNFPYLISSDNYNMIIVPKGTDYEKWEKTFVGTGPFVMKTYQPKVGATFSPNPSYWGGKVLPSELQFIFYPTQQPQILALQAGNVDIVNLIVPQGAEAVLNDPSYNLLVSKSSQHRELSMRCDQAPWDNKLVRQAMALSLNRPGIITCAVQAVRPARQRQPVRADLSLDRHQRAAAVAGHRQGQAAAVAGRTPQRVQHRAVHRGLPGDSAVRPDHQAGGRRRRHQHQPARAEPGRLLR